MEPGEYPFVCKKSMYDDFRSVCEEFERPELLDVENYYEAKQMAFEYQKAKASFYRQLSNVGCGDWVKKPTELDFFA